MLKVIKLVSVLTIATFTFVSCSSNEQTHQEKVKAQVENQNESFAKSVVAANENSVYKFPNSIFGPNTSILISNFYENALGQSCRKAFILNALGHKTQFAVCEIEPGKWKTIEPIFEM